MRWFCALSPCCHEELIGNRGSYLEDAYFTVHVLSNLTFVLALSSQRAELLDLTSRVGPLACAGVCEGADFGGPGHVRWHPDSG